ALPSATITNTSPALRPVRFPDLTNQLRKSFTPTPCRGTNGPDNSAINAGEALGDCTPLAPASCQHPGYLVRATEFAPRPGGRPPQLDTAGRSQPARQPRVAYSRSPKWGAAHPIQWEPSLAPARRWR